MKHPFQKLSKALGKDDSLCKHGVSDSHMQAVIRGNEFLINYEKPASRIYYRLERNLNDQMQTNIDVFHKMIEIILFLGRQGLALRGHRDDSVDFSKPQEVNQGNFVAMLSLSKTDTQLREHLTRAPKNALYTSKTIQEDLIAVIGDLIRNKLTEPLKMSEYPFYSIIADETTDKYANQEVVTVCIRYVDTSCHRIV